MKWEGTPRQQATACLEAADSRGQIKRIGDRLDREEEVRRCLVQIAAEKGIDLPEDVLSWPGKRLLRLVLDRAESAQVIRNPIRRDEGFVCVHCGLEVSPHGRTARNHCPQCLRSLHVDIVPGDRLSSCHGVLEPVGLSFRGGDPVIHYRCRKCNAEGVNRALEDGDPPDDPAALRRLSAQERL